MGDRVKNFESDKFLDKVREISWFSLYMCQNPSKAVELLTKNLTNILDSMAPIRTIQVRAKYAAWLTEETKALLKKRDIAQEAAAKSRDIDTWREYKHLRNRATAKMRAEKKSWEQKKLDKAQHSPSNI